MSTQQRNWLWIVVLAQAFVSSLHGLAHVVVDVHLSLLGYAFISTLTYVLPGLALWLIARQLPRQGMAIMVVSLAGALFFGLYNHYMRISPDHVDHLPGEDGHGFFQITAMLVLWLDAIATLYSVWLFGKVIQMEHVNG